MQETMLKAGNQAGQPLMAASVPGRGVAKGEPGRA